MSREQWGHGYHKGIQDALYGDIQYEIQYYADNVLKLARSIPSKKSYRSIKMICALLYIYHGLEEEKTMKIIEWINKNNYQGCYITSSIDGIECLVV